MKNKKLNDFASRLILSTTIISCNTDMPQSRDISLRATKSLLLHLKKSKPAKLITGFMTSESSTRIPGFSFPSGSFCDLAKKQEEETAQPLHAH